MQDNKTSFKYSFLFPTVGSPVGQTSARSWEEAALQALGWPSDGVPAQYSEGPGFHSELRRKTGLAESACFPVNQLIG